MQRNLRPVAGPNYTTLPNNTSPSIGANLKYLNWSIAKLKDSTSQPTHSLENFSFQKQNFSKCLVNRPQIIILPGVVRYAGAVFSSVSENVKLWLSRFLPLI